MSTENTDRLKELQTALGEKKKTVQQISDSFEIKDGTVHVTPEQKAALDTEVAALRQIRGLIESLTEADGHMKWADSPAQESTGLAAGAEMATKSAQEAFGPKSLGQMFTDSKEFKDLGGGRNGAESRAFEVKAANIGSMWRLDQKDVYAGAVGTIGTFPSGQVQRDPMIDRQRRTARVRDLFPVQRTNAVVIEYFRVTGFTNNAAPVAQRNADNSGFAIKPQSGLSFGGEQAPVRTLAHWEAAHRHVLQDEPQLRGIIDNELLYGLRLVEDAQILAGSGVGENLRGILNTPGIQQYAWSDGATDPVPDTKADALRRAATLSFLAMYEPTGIVLHPNDWEDIELTKNTSGDYLLAVSIALGGEQRLWRMPVVDSPAIPEGTALLGSFGIGAQLYDREEANIRISEHHADFFIRNAVVILAEQRLALAVKRPESFVEISFDAEPTP